MGTYCIESLLIRFGTRLTLSFGDCFKCYLAVEGNPGKTGFRVVSCSWKSYPLTYSSFSSKNIQIECQKVIFQNNSDSLSVDAKRK